MMATGIAETRITNADGFRLIGMMKIGAGINVEHWLGLCEWHEVSEVQGDTILWYTILPA